MKTFLSVVGARPNFMKVAPLHRALQSFTDQIRHVICHTGQHYDEKMSTVFFEDLELPRPDIYLGIGSGSHAEQTANVMISFEKVLLELQPDLVIVVGDVNSTLACSVTAAKLHIPVAHVEAGLRSFDRDMPEEINRMVTDVLADYLFVTEQAGMDNLRREGISEDKLFFVGHVMIDSLKYYREKAAKSPILASFDVLPKTFTLVTLHRPSNVDVKENLERILTLFETLQDQTRFIFPVHPRTHARIDEFGLRERFNAIDTLTLCDPVGYLDFLKLMDNAALILTDSGGIQEESTWLRIPCITLRESTERPVTAEIGTNEVVGLNIPLAVEKSRAALNGNGKRGTIPELWDGRAAERIVEILMERLDVNNE
ncbi:MAG: UDP-N-acetylglucosamine 2-epimerase (non-hydrolyzing) [Bacteroidetes bacterium]|nr:UDP-N-acetylglucosamine 2-epimerase (non-hydrolyzing) [Bacteroidota bacterium]